MLDDGEEIVVNALTDALMEAYGDAT